MNNQLQGNSTSSFVTRSGEKIRFKEAEVTSLSPKSHLGAKWNLPLPACRKMQGEAQREGAREREE